jgi:hypothetical protein
MNNKIFLILAFIGIIGLSAGCEKDETIVKLTANPVLPTIVTIPDLTFDLAHAKDTIVFVCSPTDVGFTASTKYILEACVSGKGFTTKETMRIYFGDEFANIETTVEKVNKLFKAKKLVAGTPSPIDFRVRAQLTVDAGTGALGSSTNPMQYISETVTANTTIY